MENMENTVLAQKFSQTLVHYDRLIQSVWQRNRQQFRDYKRKMKARRKLYEALHDNLTINFDLFVVGSTQTQFCLKSSDLDLCMLVYDKYGQIDKKFLNDRVTKIALLRKIKNIIQQKINPLAKVTVLETARVPILKIEKTDLFFRTAFDLNVNGDVSIRNTFLLALYQEIDTRVAPLVMAVKSWATKQEIHSPFHGTLSSYSLSLLVIHYLQNCPQPILPKIQVDETDGFSVFDNIVQTGYLQEPLIDFLCEISKKFQTENDWGLGRLFYHFFEYYVNRFNRDIRYFSIRPDGSKMDNNHPDSDPIWIEDPFQLHNTASTVTLFTVRRIIKAFQEALLSLAGFTFSRKHLDL